MDAAVPGMGSPWLFGAGPFSSLVATLEKQRSGLIVMNIASAD
jgi:hypothetical protein